MTSPVIDDILKRLEFKGIQANLLTAWIKSLYSLPESIRASVIGCLLSAYELNKRLKITQGPELEVERLVATLIQDQACPDLLLNEETLTTTLEGTIASFHAQQKRYYEYVACIALRPPAEREDLLAIAKVFHDKAHEVVAALTLLTVAEVAL